MKDPMFDEALNKAELSVWQSLKSVVTNFLGNHQNAGYEKKIEDLLKFPPTRDMNVSETALSAVSLGQLTKELWRFSEEQGERFHQDIHIMEEGYQEWWGVNFLADSCRCLKRDAVAAEHRVYFCEYISLKSRIICFIQQENK